MTARQRISVDATPRLVPTLALKAASCAAALDISLSAFLALVAEGKMPKAIQIQGHKGLALYDFEAVRKAWRALAESAGGSDAEGEDTWADI